VWQGDLIVPSTLGFRNIIYNAGETLGMRYVMHSCPYSLVQTNHSTSVPIFKIAQQSFVVIDFVYRRSVGECPGSRTSARWKAWCVCQLSTNSDIVYRAEARHKRWGVHSFAAFLPFFASRRHARHLAWINCRAILAKGPAISS
jgi:hypothetical protein